MSARLARRGALWLLARRHSGRAPDPPHSPPRRRMAGGSLTDDAWSQELAALVEHALLNDFVGSHQD